MAIWLGTPISTTHTIAGSITGVGLARKGSSARWDVAGDIIFAWVMTLPATGLMGAIAYLRRASSREFKYKLPRRGVDPTRAREDRHQEIATKYPECKERQTVTSLRFGFPFHGYAARRCS
jgi:hypothetical protein